MQYILVGLLVFGLSLSAQAEDESQQEIAYLLSYIADSSCTFIRNGDSHDAKEALKHIKRKYDHFEDDIDSAESFIQLSASRSTISRRAYLIQCPGEAEITSESWLMQALNNYRKQNQADALAN